MMDTEKRTPMHAAAYCGETDCVTALTQAGQLLAGLGAALFSAVSWCSCRVARFRVPCCLRHFGVVVLRLLSVAFVYVVSICSASSSVVVYVFLSCLPFSLPLCLHPPLPSPTSTTTPSPLSPSLSPDPSFVPSLLPSLTPSPSLLPSPYLTSPPLISLPPPPLSLSLQEAR